MGTRNNQKLHKLAADLHDAAADAWNDVLVPIAPDGVTNVGHVAIRRLLLAHAAHTRAITSSLQAVKWATTTDDLRIDLADAMRLAHAAHVPDPERADAVLVDVATVEQLIEMHRSIMRMHLRRSHQ